MTPPRHARLLRLPLVALLLLSFAACDSNEDEERLGISGRWSGDLVTDDPDNPGTELRLPVTMTLEDNINRVIGFGSVQIPTETLEFTIAGLFAPPNLSLDLTFDRPPLGGVSGNVSPGRDFIDATMDGPGLVNGRVEFRLVMQRME